MLMFSPEFIPVKQYPGYVWNVKEQRLYSYKFGSLKKLAITRHNFWNPDGPKEPHYRISHLGQKKLLLVSQLKLLAPDYEIHVVPTKTF